MSNETCRVCKATGGGGAGCFTSDEGVCRGCYAELYAALAALAEKFGDSTVIGCLASASAALADRVDSANARQAAEWLDASAGRIANAGVGDLTLADACRVLGDA